MSVITSSRDQLGWVATRTQALLILAYCTGAAALAGEGAVHVEEYVTLVHRSPGSGRYFSPTRRPGPSPSSDSRSGRRGYSPALEGSSSRHSRSAGLS
jgi:hypothetical protein